jgi:hypothetical protein
MSKKLISLAILGVVFAFLFAFGTQVLASTDRDLSLFTKDDVNRFGDDRAYTSPKGIDRDADIMMRSFVPNTYGLQGDIGYDGGGAG